MSLVLTYVIVQFNLSTLYYSKPQSNFQLCYLLHTPTQQRMAMALASYMGGGWPSRLRWLWTHQETLQE